MTTWTEACSEELCSSSTGSAQRHHLRGVKRFNGFRDAGVSWCSFFKGDSAAKGSCREMIGSVIGDVGLVGFHVINLFVLTPNLALRVWRVKLLAMAIVLFRCSHNADKPSRLEEKYGCEDGQTGTYRMTLADG
uniref:Uncharacterized protein n=1 Tax=Oryza meridionalis TaxID=40149 RepID=A0A0E0ELJ3_9ORYZ